MIIALVFSIVFSLVSMDLAFKHEAEGAILAGVAAFVFLVLGL